MSPRTSSLKPTSLGSSALVQAGGAPGTEARAGLPERTFDWHDAPSDDYASFLDRLRQAGMPEDRVRRMVLEDVDQWFAGRLLEMSTAHDEEYWRVNSTVTTVDLLRELGLRIEEDRAELLSRLLGAERSRFFRPSAKLWSSVPLTGPELGALSREKHQQVQEIRLKAIERHHAYVQAQLNRGAPLNELELAALRERTRSELREVLAPAEMAAFLMRYSLNTKRLRAEFDGLEPTREEFERLFLALDPIDHRLQLEFGGSSALSANQRARWRRQRDQALRRVLSPERYQAYRKSVSEAG